MEEGEEGEEVDDEDDEEVDDDDDNDEGAEDGDDQEDGDEGTSSLRPLSSTYNLPSGVLIFLHRYSPSQWCRGKHRRRGGSCNCEVDCCGSSIH